MICDAEMANDVFATHNKKVTKTGQIQQSFEDFGGRPFSFEPSNSFWRRRRKLFANVFHEFDMENMLEVLKE